MRTRTVKLRKELQPESRAVPMRVSQPTIVRFSILSVLALTLALVDGGKSSSAEELSLSLRYQQETSPDSDRYHQLTRDENWKASETAIIVCDMWDAHHCLNAVRREKEFAPVLNEVLSALRQQGVTIIHAPSDCMEAYSEHPSRQRAEAIPKSQTLPENINTWCHSIPSEEQAEYPIDQSDGGEDDDPIEHALWAAQLEAQGLDPKAPWKKQIDLLTIDEDVDFISDQGDEIWSLLESRKINNVILAGVHTNMCVLGRPFGLRQMAQNGKHVVLMRDLTDTMYNPEAAPFVSHFSGTDLIIDHIERHVCPTITSDQILGGKPFRFSNDVRPRVAIMIAETEYGTEETLPKFAEQKLRKDCQLRFFYGSENDRNLIPGINTLAGVDTLLISVRRRLLPTDDLKIIRDLIKAGTGVVGIRTASHAFSIRSGDVPEGHANWPEFDAEVFGGSYTNHYANDLSSTVSFAPNADVSPLTTDVDLSDFSQAGSLYRTAPLHPGTHVLATAKAEGKPVEPIAWTMVRRDGGRSFYTSLGHAGDFQKEPFQQLLRNAILHCAQ